MASASRSELVVIGAGMGGLSAAVVAAARGWRVTLVEKETAPGGKMRRVPVAGRELDGGPTVFTMKWAFDRVFAAAGASLDERVRLSRAETIARHAWTDGSRLDLFADPEASRAAIADFAGAAEAERFDRFRADARKIYQTLRDSYIAAQRPNPLELARRAGIMDMTGIKPFSTMWEALGDSFRDPRLRQLFGRYATYCGSDPWKAPATLMLVAHVEMDGLWLVEGGMHALARAVAELAEELGVEIRYGEAAVEIETSRGRVSGVRLEGGDRLPADAAIFNGDVAALAAGRLGPAARKAVPAMPPADRSLSAVVTTAVGRASGFPLLHHTVFFSDAYKDEFERIFRGGELPGEPTVYVCAQDRSDGDRSDGDRSDGDRSDGDRSDGDRSDGDRSDGDRSHGDRGDGAADAPEANERLYFLVNAPARADRRPFTPEEIAACHERTWDLLKRCGLTVEAPPEATVTTTPNEWNALFPATGGALYGRASHGWSASFQRAGARSKLPGLYLAGGSVHPGPGVPMAAISGSLAAERLLADTRTGGSRTGASTSGRRWFRAGTSGGTWTG
jgi:1-hydroxycarotenoid 3,4-desaturase